MCLIQKSLSPCVLVNQKIPYVHVVMNAWFCEESLLVCIFILSSMYVVYVYLHCVFIFIINVWAVVAFIWLGVCMCM